jgi:hypothetical protein
VGQNVSADTTSSTHRGNCLWMEEQSTDRLKSLYESTAAAESYFHLRLADAWLWCRCRYRQVRAAGGGLVRPFFRGVEAVLLLGLRVFLLARSCRGIFVSARGIELLPCIGAIGGALSA